MDIPLIQDALSQLADDIMPEEECKRIILAAMGFDPKLLTELQKMREIAALWEDDDDTDSPKEEETG